MKFIATSRISQMRAIREAGICKKPLMLIRIPMLSELPDVVELCDISLQSDIIVLRALNEEALAFPTDQTELNCKPFVTALSRINTAVAPELEIKSTPFRFKLGIGWLNTL